MKEPTARSLSEYLLAKASVYSLFPHRIRRTEWNLEWASEIRQRFRRFVACRESFEPPSQQLPAQEIEKGFPEWFDDLYSRELLEMVPDMVGRTLQLARLATTAFPEPAISLYVREASRAYVFGFFQASVTLSRVALEAGLRTKLRSEFPSADAELDKIIAFAGNTRLLDPEHQGRADKVRVLGNRVLHKGHRANKAEALSTLTSARDVLMYAYRDRE